MDKDKAKELLSFHSSRNSDIHNPKWENGFLGSLRPFRGKLSEENFIEVMECLKVLKGEFESATVEKEIIADIVAIIYLPFRNCVLIKRELINIHCMWQINIL